MLRSLLCACALVASAAAQTTSTQIELANLREDVRGLTQRVGDLALRVDQLEHANADLQTQVRGAQNAYVTLGQLNEAIAEVNRTIQSATAQSKAETLEVVSRQMEKLAKETNAAIDSLAKGGGAPAPAPASFGNDYPKEGISYTVQKGDTLALIAKNKHAKVQDIVNANKLADPSHIVPGQTLFIPGGK